MKVLKQTTVQKTNSERRNVLTHRGWLKRVWPAEHWVSCGHQLLEISLELVQIWAVIKWLRQWNVSCKVSEDRLLLVDWLCLPPVVVNVRLERCWLDAVGEKDINERKNIQFQGNLNFSTKSAIWAHSKMGGGGGGVDERSLNLWKKQKLIFIVFILDDDHGHLRGFDQGIRIGGAERSQATGRTAPRHWRQTRAGDNAEGGEDNFSELYFQRCKKLQMLQIYLCYFFFSWC